MWTSTAGCTWRFGSRETGCPAIVPRICTPTILTNPGPAQGLWNSIGHHSFALLFQRSVAAEGGDDGGDDGEKLWLDARFVAETIADLTMVRPGQQFIQTWTLENNGTQPWPEGSSLVRIDSADGAAAGGLALSSAERVALPAAQPGARRCVGAFVAPMAAGATPARGSRRRQRAALWRPRVGNRLCGRADDLSAARAGGAQAGAGSGSGTRRGTGGRSSYGPAGANGAHTKNWDWTSTHRSIRPAVPWRPKWHIPGWRRTRV